ncbi:MAG: zinc-ribbon domain-containing protein [Firmicutes bacterium]|nr:zinc-ribbon domain-containing protein [Bacillota bacterium]
MGLWDQVKQQASSLGTKAAEKTQELRLQSEINDLKSQISAKQTNLGVLIYQMYKEDRGNYDALLPICHEIDELEKEIAEIEQKIAELRAKPGRCPKCGHNNVSNARFCANCGTSLQEAQEAPVIEATAETKVNVCPQCNTEQPEDAKFCTQCGYKLA